MSINTHVLIIHLWILGIHCCTCMCGKLVLGVLLWRLVLFVMPNCICKMKNSKNNVSLITLFETSQVEISLRLPISYLMNGRFSKYFTNNNIESCLSRYTVAQSRGHTLFSLVSLFTRINLFSIGCVLERDVYLPFISIITSTVYLSLTLILTASVITLWKLLTY